MPSSRFYDENEAEEILRIAIHEATPDGAMSRDRLIATAAELGITEDALVRAEEELARRKTESAREIAQTAEFEEYRIHRRRSLWGDVGSWLSVSLVLGTINFLISGHLSWSLWPIGIWGAVEIGNVVESLFMPPRRDRSFERWRRKRRKREEAEIASQELAAR